MYRAYPLESINVVSNNPVALKLQRKKNMMEGSMFLNKMIKQVTAYLK